jgi:hypothetical protein
MEQRAGARNHGAYTLKICVDYYVDEYCFHRQHAQWRTHLLEPETLPELDSVVSLCLFNACPSAKLDYRTMLDLATRFPNLEELECRVGQDE